MSKLDAEYKAMRRRMSNLRVSCGKQKTALEAEDIPSHKGDPGDTGFKDLVKFWKKHGIPIPSELLTDMADENVKQAAARGRGRRRSRELEDLHLCASTGKFKLEKISPILEASETPRKAATNTPPGKKKVITRMQSDSSMLTKSRGGSVKKPSPIANGQTNKKVVSRSISKS